jgi:hypothetical protein
LTSINKILVRISDRIASSYVFADLDKNNYE